LHEDQFAKPHVLERTRGGADVATAFRANEHDADVLKHR